MTRLMVGVALLSTFAVAVDAQAPAVDRQTIVQTSPLGFLQFGPTFEVVRKVAPKLAISGGVRFASLGLIPILIADSDGDVLNFSFTVGGSVLFLPTGELKGWYVGPHIEGGPFSSALYTSTVFVFSSDFGYRWMQPSGFTLSLGGAGGMAFDKYTHRTDVSDRGTDIYPFAMLVFNIGIAF